MCTVYFFISYKVCKVYKNSPDVLRLLWRLMGARDEKGTFYYIKTKVNKKRNNAPNHVSHTNHHTIKQTQTQG